MSCFEQDKALITCSLVVLNCYTEGHPPSSWDLFSFHRHHLSERRLSAITLDAGQVKAATCKPLRPLQLFYRALGLNPRVALPETEWLDWRISTVVARKLAEACIQMQRRNSQA